MPDFLHRDTAHDLQPPVEGKKAVPPASLREALRARVNKKSKSTKPSKSTAADRPVKTKKPSRLFVDYYGALFLLLVSAFILAGWLLLRPLILEFKTLGGAAETAAATLKDERDYLQSLRRSVAAAQAIPADVLNRVDEALPRQVGIPKLLQTMAVLAESSRIKLNSVQFNEPKKTAPTFTGGITVAGAGSTGEPAMVAAGSKPRALSYAPLEIALTLSSPGYMATRAYLEALERSLRVLDVQQISVTGNEQTGELTYSIQLQTYYLTP